MKALLVIDMQKGLLAETYKENIVENVKKLIDGARTNEIPIIHMKYIGLKEGLAFEKWGPLCLEGTEDAEINEQVKPLENEPVIERHANSGFYKTELEALLKEKEIDELIVIGIYTDYCVLATCLDAFYRNIKTYVVKEATSGSSKEIEESMLEHLGEFSSEIIDLEKATAMLK